jgi:hypothetical protein
MCEPHADHAADDLSGRLMAAVSFGGLVAVAALNVPHADPAVIRNSVQLGREGWQPASGKAIPGLARARQGRQNRCYDTWQALCRGCNDALSALLPRRLAKAAYALDAFKA